MNPWRLALRAERWRARIGRGLAARLGGNGTVYVHERADEYRRYWEDGARRVGAELVPLTPAIWEVRRGDRRVRIANHATPCDDPATRQLAGDKPWCHDLARRVGIPVPDYIVVGGSDLEPARAFFDVRKGPLVVKPARDTSSGLGVTTMVDRWSRLVRAVALASLYGREVMIERMVAGETCRLLFLDGRMIHAVRRRGLRVEGDGRRSLAELASGAVSLGDANARFTLAASGRAWTDVPAAGESVLIRGLPPSTRRTRELRTVYDETVTASCSPDLVSELLPLLGALGTEFAGIDIITNDLGKPLRASGGTFLEINTTPGIHHHYITPDDFAVNPVANQVLAYLLGPGRA